MWLYVVYKYILAVKCQSGDVGSIWQESGFPVVVKEEELVNGEINFCLLNYFVFFSLS